ncbi:hypothetical protein KIW84_071538 [Lathyrus oleraceus]|uniref:Uncharacterized protein n=1 Tax=Pisum sativum TaxID=3888 RepID=A0A9D4VIJ6_PEA|nr:hypothetical protein KIW84_071538 [Pisum sativum]
MSSVNLLLYEWCSQMPLLSAINTSTLPLTFKSHPFRNPSCFLQTLNANPNSDSGSDDDSRNNSATLTLSSSRALASALRKVSISPVDFTQRLEKDRKNGPVHPSPDFHRLCLQQLHLFRRIVPESFLSVYVRPAGSYVMDQLELRRVALYPEEDSESEEEGIVILVGHFHAQAGLRAAETALSELQVNVVPECKAIVLPMVKHPFVVGFLVAELPLVELETCEKKAQSDRSNNRVSRKEVYSLSPFLDLDKKSWETQTPRVKDEPVCMRNFTSDQRSNAVDISQSLAMAYVMDQKAMLLQQSTWQNNVRMNNLVEQIHGPLSSIQSLSKILSTQTKKSQISHDIVEDILVLGDRLRDVLHQLQDAVYVTKTNIMRHNEEAIKKMNHMLAESEKTQLLDSSPVDSSANKMNKSGEPPSLSAAAKDIEMPLPPLALSPLQLGIRKTVQCF